MLSKYRLNVECRDRTTPSLEDIGEEWNEKQALGCYSLDPVPER